MIAFAMGIHIAFNRLYNKEAFGSATVLTGRVTQPQIYREALQSCLRTEPNGEAYKKQFVIIGGCEVVWRCCPQIGRAASDYIFRAAAYPAVSGSCPGSRIRFHGLIF
jgi:hypothetical protein